MCSLLGASRQIYEEGYRLFWITNTFSFDDPYSFGEFLGSLTLSQKRHLTSLHVVRRMYDPVHRESEWRHDGSFLPLLQGLKTLHLCFEQRTYSNPLDAQYQRMAQREQTLLTEMCRPWSALRTSPLANVTVIISDKRAHLLKHNFLMNRCTVAEKNWMAEKIRESLTNEEAVAQARQEMLEARALRNESNRRYKARMVLRSQGCATDSISEQAVVVSKARSPSYPDYVQPQHAYGQLAYSPHHQTDALRIPLAWYDSGDQHQVPAVIADPLHQITVHAPAWRNLDMYQQNHMTQRDLSKHSMGGLNEQQHEPLLQGDLNDSLDRWIADASEQQQPKVTLPPQLGADASAASYHVPVHHDYRPSLHLTKLATGPQNPLGRSLDVRQRDALSQAEAQQQALARQPANDIYQAYSLRNNHTQQWNPPDVHYPGARSIGVILPSYAGPINVNQSLAQEHQAFSRYQGGRRHVVEERADERFHPYPRPARQQQEHRAVEDGDIHHRLSRIVEEKSEAEIQAANAAYPARQSVVEEWGIDHNLRRIIEEKSEAEIQAAYSAYPATQRQAHHAVEEWDIYPNLRRIIEEEFEAEIQAAAANAAYED